MILTAADAAAATEKNGKDTDTASSGPTTIPTEEIPTLALVSFSNAMSE